MCQAKALEQGIRTARLPIGTYLAKLPTRKVLTVNQVFEILVKWLETRNWEQSLLDVMPKRKFKDPNAAAALKDAEGESDGDWASEIQVGDEKSMAESKVHSDVNDGDNTTLD